MSKLVEIIFEEDTSVQNFNYKLDFVIEVLDTGIIRSVWRDGMRELASQINS